MWHEPVPPHSVTSCKLRQATKISVLKSSLHGDFCIATRRCARGQQHQETKTGANIRGCRRSLLTSKPDQKAPRRFAAVGTSFRSPDLVMHQTPRGSVTRSPPVQVVSYLCTPF